MILSTRGLTLLEVLIASAVFGGIAYSLSSLLVSQAKLSAQSDRQDSLVRLLQTNLVELDAKSVANLPVIGKCAVRLYNLAGSFQSESIVLTNDDACRNAIPENPGMKILIIPKDVDPAGTDFLNPDNTPNTFLKLPTSVSTLRAIQIRGGSKGAESSSRTFQLSMTVFKQ